MAPELLAQANVASHIDLLSKWIETQITYTGQPAISIGVVYDQELVWSKGFGYADVAKKTLATPQTIYRMASITKVFTSTAIMQLRDAGKLRLSDPITKHLPWFRIQNPYSDAPSITIRHLLTHTAGLPREAAFPYWTDDVFPTFEQIKAALPDQATVLPTETTWKYSNLAYSLAGEIVAVVSGQAYADYIQHHILDPLDLKSTYITPPDPAHPQLAAGYGRRLPDATRNISPFTDCKGLAAAGNMSSTVEDMARFVMLQFGESFVGGKQILSNSTLHEMHRVQWLDPDWKAGWGLGFRLLRYGEKTHLVAAGGLSGYRTQINICPADKTGAIVLTNADDCNSFMYMEKAFEWVVPAILEAVKPVPIATEPDPTWKQYAGKYWHDVWGDLQVLILNGDLVMLDPTGSAPTAALQKLIFVAEHTFRIETQDGFSSNAELVIFEFDASGEVERIKISENYYIPKKNG